MLPINPGQAGSGYNSSDAWDYFHINSVDKDAGGNYLISARDACAIHKVNGTDGEIIWVSSHLSYTAPIEYRADHLSRTATQWQEVRFRDEEWHEVLLPAPCALA